MYALLIPEGGQISHTPTLDFAQSHRLASPGVTKRNGSEERVDIRTGDIIKGWDMGTVTSPGFFFGICGDCKKEQTTTMSTK